MKLIIPEKILAQHLVVLENEDKTCTRCGVTKSLEEFGLQKVNGVKRYRKPACKACDVDRSRLYRLTTNGKASRSLEGKKRFQAILGLYKSVKSQQKCLLCDEDDPACIDFHHLTRATKRREVVDALRCSFSRFVDEVCKCICLCANCHRKHHAGRATLPNNTQPLSREWVMGCLAIARTQAGLPEEIKQQEAA